MTEFIPANEKRDYHFDGANSDEQSEILSQIKINAPNFVLVSRLEKNLDMGEFKKVVSNIGKPKVFYALARWSEILGR